MKQWARLASVIALLLAGAEHPSWAQDEINLLDGAGIEKNNRSAVIFMHDEHNETAQIDECNECHHVYEDGQKLDDESSEDQRCADCHDLKSAGNSPGLRKAFHLNCKGCHLKESKGPVMCGQCHER